MATARQIIALLNSHNQGNEEQFLSIALQVAANEARRGRMEVADELKRLVEKARSRRDLTPRATSNSNSVAIPITRPRGELQGLFYTSHPKSGLSDVVLHAPLKARLDRVVAQQRRRDALREYGKTPKARLLFVGPAGSGKSMTAAALAGELYLPLHQVRIDTLITRFMGETAAKLRLIFDQIASSRGVYLFDEFDAIGGRRNADNDVGEMRRVLNSFLQFMEEANSTDSLIIAATNYPDLLDAALFRRFDDILEYSLPNFDAAKAIIEARLGAFKPARIGWSRVEEETAGLSQAELARACDEVIKEAILRGSKRATTDDVVTALIERRSVRQAISGLNES